MPRIGEVSRKDLHASAQPVFNMLFGDRDPTTSPGTGTGTPGNWWTVFANVPDIFDHAVSGFTLYQQPEREIDGRLRELAVARAGYCCSSQFVFSQHCKACRDVGLSDVQIEAIPSWSVATCFSTLERAVLALTDALSLEHGRVDDEIFSILKTELSDKAIFELTYIASMYVMHAGISRALRLEYDDVGEWVREVPTPNGKTGLAETLVVDPGEVPAPER